ncbi:cobalamin biosynthesis protein [Methylocystis heyeri]|uniref:Cobalamin biosynthesis protein CbiG n=1 Tax=Methylocystis heyeri TaxID=391905 RepID=A0A6B8KCG0_9HYPH|nr:cobalamin biosynthesis protein [Methylocystis heyeri]QGM45272.1 cobalamin biosynthesis protein CbiG [Methylocystis heyeri]
MAGREDVTWVYAFGVGARPGADPDALVALLREIAASHGLDLKKAILATMDARENEAGIHAAAKILEMKLLFLPIESLQRRNADGFTRSLRVVELFGVGSIAETAALAGAGEGSRLLAPRTVAGALTCAIARGTSKGAEK